MKTRVTAIFDIGKTNKKILLFDEMLSVVHQEEKNFEEVFDDDGFACDDIEKLELWIRSSVLELIGSDKYELTAVNFATYGATLVYLDNRGKRIAPLYNYEKPLTQPVDKKVYNRYGGESEFCRKTASPALGSLNSGFQILDFKNSKGKLWRDVKSILHFPQYLSFLFTGHIVSEHTSIGCHTAMWNFDEMRYHKWLIDEEINLPLPTDIKQTAETVISGKRIDVGIGIHDSSASLVPYLKGAKKRFVLISTGTWCINMNPFNHSPLTKEELGSDCLNFLSIEQKPVKSSRLFLGRIHDKNVKYMASQFSVSSDFYKTININEELTNRLIESKQATFFREGILENHIDTLVDYSLFNNISEAYHALVVSLTKLVAESVNLVIEEDNRIEELYITGGFTRNKIFTKSISLLFSNKNVYTSKVDNATSLGAAIVINSENKLDINLGLTKV